METVSIDVMQDPGVKRAWDKLQGFNGEIAASEKRITEINGRIGEFGKGNRVSPTERAAQALVAGSSIKDIDQDLETLRKDLGAGWDRLRVLHRAAELQKKALKGEEARASREICERIEPEYRAIVAGLAKSMITLGKAMMADITFFETLRDGDVMHSSLRWMNVAALGDPRDRHGRLAMWLQEAIAFGLINETTVPADWRESWNR